MNQAVYARKYELCQITPELPIWIVTVNLPIIYGGDTSSYRAVTMSSEGYHLKYMSKFYLKKCCFESSLK
jgi:hypothetical protein